MSNRLFPPTYRIPGVTYSDHHNEDAVRSSSFPQHLQLNQRKPRDGIMSVRPADDNEGKTLNPNTYATRKTVAQGMLDIALLTANASQLRYVLSLGDRHENYELMVGLIVTSLVLQALSGISNAVLAGLNINKESMQSPANMINIISSGLAMLVMANDLIIMGMGGGSSLRSINKTTVAPPTG